MLTNSARHSFFFISSCHNLSGRYFLLSLSSLRPSQLLLAPGGRRSGTSSPRAVWLLPRTSRRRRHPAQGSGSSPKLSGPWPPRGNAEIEPASQSGRLVTLVQRSSAHGQGGGGGDDDDVGDDGAGAGGGGGDYRGVPRRLRHQHPASRSHEEVPPKSLLSRAQSSKGICTYEIISLYFSFFGKCDSLTSCHS